MTINTIKREIESRLSQLQTQYKEIQEKITYCKLYGTEKEFNNLISKRNIIYAEKDKLLSMLNVINK